MKKYTWNVFSHLTTVHIYFLHLQKPNAVYRALSGRLSGCTDYFKGLKGSEVWKRMYFNLNDLAEKTKISGTHYLVLAWFFLFFILTLDELFEIINLVYS